MLSIIIYNKLFGSNCHSNNSKFKNYVTSIGSTGVKALTPMFRVFCLAPVWLIVGTTLVTTLLISRDVWNAWYASGCIPSNLKNTSWNGIMAMA